MKNLILTLVFTIAITLLLSCNKAIVYKANDNEVIIELDNKINRNKVSKDQLYKSCDVNVTRHRLPGGKGYWLEMYHDYYDTLQKYNFGIVLEKKKYENVSYTWENDTTVMFKFFNSNNDNEAKLKMMGKPNGTRLEVIK